MNTKNHIQILITGGTLDKDYNPLTGELFFPDTHLPELLQQANHTLNVHTQVVLQKDSLDFTDADRNRISEACQNTEATHIIITHGTDTMTITAKCLEKCPQLAQKTIILTGAMRPFKLGNSDAAFNLGSALMAVKLAQPGIYIAMNGHLFKANQVSKNLAKGIFEPTAHLSNAP